MPEGRVPPGLESPERGSVLFTIFYLFKLGCGSIIGGVRGRQKMRRVVILPILSLTAVFADRIVFVDDLELAGDDVWIIDQDEEGVTVQLLYGQVKIVKNRIKKIEIDYREHKEQLIKQGKDLPSSLYKLGALCESNGMIEEALDAYQSALDRDRITPISESLLLKLADAFERHENYALAYRALDTLSKRYPGKKDVLERMTALYGKIREKLPEVKETPPEKPEEVPPPVEKAAEEEVEKATPKPTVEKEPEKPAETQPEAQPPEEQPRWIEGLESNPKWEVETWANKARAQVVEETPKGEEPGKAKVKNKVLRVELLSGDKDKTAVKLFLTNKDLSSKQALTLQVFNATEGVVQLAVAFQTLPGWQWFESRVKSLKPNEWTNVTFDLTRKSYKSRATAWRFRTEILNRDQTAALILLIYHKVERGVVFFDNIFFRTKEELE